MFKCVPVCVRERVCVRGCVYIYPPCILSIWHDYSNHRVKVRLQDKENSHQVMKDNTTVIAK